MAVQREREFISEPPSFAKGTRPETARLLEDERMYGVIDRFDPRDRLMVERYFYTPARLSDIAAASGLSSSRVHERLRGVLINIRETLPEHVRHLHSDEATFLKTRRWEKHPTKPPEVRLPFQIEVRRDEPEKIASHKAAMQKLSERPYVFFTSSEYLLRSFRPPVDPEREVKNNLLSIQERILFLLGKGLNLEQIAFEVGESLHRIYHLMRESSLQNALEVSSPHEALALALERGLLDIDNLSKGLNVGDDTVSRLSSRQVEVLLADTIDNLGETRDKVAQVLGISCQSLDKQRKKIYEKIGVINRMQATVFVLAYVQKARRAKRYPIKEQPNDKQLGEYIISDVPVDIRYAIEELDRTGIRSKDKLALMLYYLWHINERETNLIEGYLGINDQREITNSIDRVIDGQNDPVYTHSLTNIYQIIFGPIAIASDIFYNYGGDKSHDRFKALVSAARKRTHVRRFQESLMPPVKRAVNIEVQRLLDQRRSVADTDIPQ